LHKLESVTFLAASAAFDFRQVFQSLLTGSLSEFRRVATAESYGKIGINRRYATRIISCISHAVPKGTA
jgi:hypothetical protein